MRPVPDRATRPANRRELILAAATELFAARGYEHVGMIEIAGAVAVRPSALYRHFSGKEQLLDEILQRGVAQLSLAVQALDLIGPGGGLLELAGFAIDHRDIGALTGRELPHLAGASRAGLLSALAGVGDIMSAKITSARPELGPRTADTLATAGGPASALRALIASYAQFAVAHSALIDLMISEVRSLPEPHREATVTAQRDYVAELVHLLRQVSPDLSQAGARVQVRAALTVANEVARSPHLRGQAGSAQAVAAVCEQMLGLLVAS